ncbi:MAG: PLP-dependent cysteine synthase family protein [Gammaproteobacteria bacterium]|nr:PLP-dependent cysteine synthase family protein [Gammaproteobacteria bacterium]
MNEWVFKSVKKITADFKRSADTHMIKLSIPYFNGVDIYLKDESTHPTGSLKHRLARSLFMYALCNGKIDAQTTIIESSSGSTAVSEAYFAQLIGVPFIAVMPSSTAKSKIQQIELYGGQCHFVEHATQMNSEAQKLAKSLNGYFMDQFTYAERATDWRGNNNIADSIFKQLAYEEHAIPHTIVMSAGTGGTSATIGRYINYQGYNTRLLVVDPENSVFYDSYIKQDRSLSIQTSSHIEGIGRPQVEPSFQPDVIDSMMQVPDAASVATIHWLEKIIGRKAGASTGTNLWGVLQVAQQLMQQNQQASLVTLLCDSGERYLDTYYNSAWVNEHIGDLEPYTKQLRLFCPE